MIHEPANWPSLFDAFLVNTVLEIAFSHRYRIDFRSEFMTTRKQEKEQGLFFKLPESLAEIVDVRSNKSLCVCVRVCRYSCGCREQ